MWFAAVAHVANSVAIKCFGLPEGGTLPRAPIGFRLLRWQHGDETGLFMLSHANTVLCVFVVHMRLSLEEVQTMQTLTTKNLTYDTWRSKMLFTAHLYCTLHI